MAEIVELQAAELAIVQLGAKPRLDAAEEAILEAFHTVALFHDFQVVISATGAGCGFGDTDAEYRAAMRLFHAAFAAAVERAVYDSLPQLPVCGVHPAMTTQAGVGFHTTQ